MHCSMEFGGTIRLVKTFLTRLNYVFDVMDDVGAVRGCGDGKINSNKI
jgi:hypothetical protein